MYSRLLIATDGSELAGKAVTHGVDLAGQIGVPVVIVTVSETWSATEIAAGAQMGRNNPIEVFEVAAAKSAEAILASAGQIAKSKGVAVETVHIPDRAPAVGILEAADMYDCDLIVMASHGRRGLGRMLMGSQTAEVLAFSKVPVLVLR